MTEPDYTEPLNPYAVTHSGTTLSYPIHIGGKLTRDDLLMSLRDSPRKTGFARLQYPIAAGIIIVAVSGVDFLMVGGDEPILSVTWMIVAFTLLPAWAALAPTLTRGYRQRLKRIEVMAGNQRDEFGWFDETHFVLCAGDSIFRARWNFFDRCLVFPTHILMPLVADATRRMVVPYRFFSSAEDARHACRFLQEKVGLLLDQPPSDADLAELVAQAEASRQLNVKQARQWNKDDWPFESDSEPQLSGSQFDWAINLTADQTVPRIAFKAATAILLIMLYYFLPVWIATAAWLINDYLFFGDWGFIRDRPWSSMLVLGPAGFLIVYFIYIAVGSIVRSRTIHAQGMDVRMRSAGIHLSHATFESWFPWSETADVIVEADRAGWIAKESMDEIQFTKNCFESEDRFEEFKAMLQKLRPESSSLSSIAPDPG